MDRRGWFRIAIALGAFALSLFDAKASPGLERLTIADPVAGPVEVGVWSPEGDRRRRPLIVLSHGSGGDYRSHSDTAEALAEAGFVVAALTHSGDNWRDRSMIAAVWQRPRQLKLLVDYMTSAWPARELIDPERIGAFGFSAGGFTVLVAAGGTPDLGRIRGHCRAHPEFFDCRIAGAAALLPAMPRIEWVHDVRIRAAVVAAPALGYTFTGEGLAAVRVPVQLWAAGQDEVLPHLFYAEPVRAALPRRTDYRLIGGAGHFDFLAPCSAQAAAARPQICLSRPGFDRVAFHQVLNAAVAAFFRRHLGSRG
jgi:predicted dienelactone hydrolase